MASDFNSLLCKDEKCGGSRQAVGCKKFGKWIRDCSMVDMGFVRSRFTWRRGTVQDCLDQFICNEDWKDRVNMFRVAHLPRVQSNHSPLLSSY